MKKSSNETTFSEKEMIQFLGKVSVFDKLTKNERKNIADYFYERKFKAEEQIFKQDYPSVVFYIIKNGEVKVFLKRRGKKKEISRLKSRDFIGEIGVFLEKNRVASAIAKKESTLFAISKKDLKKFIDKFPKAGTKILYKFGEIVSTYLIDQNEDSEENESKIL